MNEIHQKCFIVLTSFHHTGFQVKYWRYRADFKQVFASILDKQSRSRIPFLPMGSICSYIVHWTRMKTPSNKPERQRNVLFWSLVSGWFNGVIETHCRCWRDHCLELKLLPRWPLYVYWTATGMYSIKKGRKRKCKNPTAHLCWPIFSTGLKEIQNKQKRRARRRPSSQDENLHQHPTHQSV